MGYSTARNTLAVPHDRTYSFSSLKRKLEPDEDAEMGSASKKHSRSTSIQSSPPSDMLLTPPIRSQSRNSNNSSSTSPGGSAAGWQGKDAGGVAIAKPDTGAGGGGDEPMIYIQGVGKPLSQYQPGDYDLMTDDEVEAQTALLLSSGIDM